MEGLIKEKEAQAHRLCVWMERLIPVCMWTWGIGVVVGIGSCALQVDGDSVFEPLMWAFAGLFVVIGFLEYRERQLTDEAVRLRRFIDSGGRDEQIDGDDGLCLGETGKLRRELDDQRSRAWEFTRFVAIISGAAVGLSSHCFISDMLGFPESVQSSRGCQDSWSLAWSASFSGGISAYHDRLIWELG